MEYSWKTKIIRSKPDQSIIGAMARTAKGAVVSAEEIRVPPESEDMARGPSLPDGVAGNGRQGEEAPSTLDLECSVGVMAYNEQENIAAALNSILTQRLTSGKIAELIVVASGCDDLTGAIVSDIARNDPRVRLIEQERREGKASAVNLFISAARCPVLVMVSADVLVKETAFDALLRHFADQTVGMVGGHPTPVNSETTLLGHAVHLLWRLHDRIACRSPKLGEIVAFRSVVPSIPIDTAVDEISIQAIISQLGYRLVYEPQAVVYNRGPSTVRDFLLQRRRIYAGHLRVRKQQHYSAPTMSAWRVARALRGSGSFRGPRAALWSIATMGLEAMARALGYYDVMRHRSPHVWEISGTTKLHIAEGVNAQVQQNVMVFHIVNFHHQQLEIGLHASRQLAKRVADQVKRTVGARAIVSTDQTGATIIAMLAGDREAAERAAHELVQQLEASPLQLNGHGVTAQVTLACAIITVPQAGSPAPRSAVLAENRRAPIAS